MKRPDVATDDAAGILALAGLGLGAALVQGIGWGLIVVCALVLIYLFLPDQKPGGPTR